jgi:hypothetical protein
MHKVKYNGQVVECVLSNQRKYTLNDDLEKLSQEYKIGLVYLKKLCDDMSVKTQYSYFDSIYVISTELFNGLNINQIIIKYNLDKELI